MKAFFAALALWIFAAVQSEGGFQLHGIPEQGGLIRGTAPLGTVALTLDGKSVPFADGGRFLIGFDRDQDGSALLVARLADGREVRQPIRVAAREWRISHVDVARRPSGPSEEFLRIRRGELARIAEARARLSDVEGWAQDMIRPASGRVSSPFGSQRIYRGESGSYHSGVDIAAGAGAPVIAPADGTVVLAPPPAFTLEGNLVIIDHGMGLNSAFLHLASVDVRAGQAVRQGQKIGTVGATGRTTGPHLHWSLMWNDARVDPAAAIGGTD